jgi:hypothetical protein
LDFRLGAGEMGGPGHYEVFLEAFEWDKELFFDIDTKVR